MFPNSIWYCLAAIGIGTCIFPQMEPEGNEIKLFRLKDFAEKWLKEEKGPNVSEKIEQILLELWSYEPGKPMPVLEKFEDAILQGKPLDPDRAALLIALNFLAESKQGFFISFATIKDKDRPFGGFDQNTARGFLSNGSLTTGLDFSHSKRLKQLGNVTVDLEIDGTMDQVEKSKEKPEAGRLTLQAVLTVSHKGGSTKYHRDLGQYRFTSEDNMELTKLPKWKMK
jgi:hypothetical protein